MQKEQRNYYLLPKTASVAVSDQGVSFQELTEIISNLSFDSPDATLNYSIEVCPKKYIQDTIAA